jgi:exodeoxyribonuclease VII small subunit
MPQSSKQIDYERLGLRLDAILTRLQDDNTSIVDSLKLYTEAMQIIKQMQTFLKTAENQLNKLKPPKV